MTVNGTTGQPLQVYADNNNYSASYVTGNTQTGTFAGNDAPVSVSSFGSAPPFNPATPTVTVATASKVVPTLAGLTAANGVKTSAMGPAAPRLLRQGKTVLLVEPVKQSQAVAQQNRAVLQNLAVSQNRLAPTVDRAVKGRNQKDRPTTAPVRQVVRPTAMAGGAGLQR